MNKLDHEQIYNKLHESILRLDLNFSVTFLNRQASLTHPDLKIGMRIGDVIKGPFWNLLNEKLELVKKGEVVYMDFDFYMIEELGATYIELFPTFENEKVIAINMIVKELLDKDHERRLFEKVFLKFSQYSGHEFFLKTVKIMCENFGFDGAFVGHLSKDRKRIICDAAFKDRKYIENFSYELKETPCQNVIENNSFFYSDEVLKIFPKDDFFINERINTYGGMSIVSANNQQVIGVVNFIARKKMVLTYTFQKQLSLLAQRMTAEYERMIILNELEIERAKTFIDANYETLGIMCGTLAHEIKNPLTIIKGYSEQILKTYRTTGAIGEKEIEKLEKVVKVNTKISSLIDGLQNYSKKDQGPIPCLVSNLINDSYLLIQMSLEDKRIPFAIEAHDRNLEIDCRPGQIQQVLVNLLRNAIEAQTKNDHNAWISLLVFDDEKNISFVIQDNGCGFTSEYLEQQNDVLYKMNSSVQHFGLGLNYVKKIIADHGGTLIIEQLKSPTSVRVILPKKQAIKIPELKKSA